MGMDGKRPVHPPIQRQGNQAAGAQRQQFVDPVVGPDGQVFQGIEQSDIGPQAVEPDGAEQRLDCRRPLPGPFRTGEQPDLLVMQSFA